MNYQYTEKDFDKISWNRIEEYMQKIYNDVQDFISKNNLSIKYVSPILRGGGIPSIILAHKFNIVDMLPIQLKYNYENNCIDKKISLDSYKDIMINTNECILLVEGNHVTGKTSNIAKNMILNKLGKDTKVIYVSITRDYYYKDNVDNILYTTCGMYTNESKKLTEQQCNELGIDYKKVSLYPWEDIEEELLGLNS